MRQSFLKKSATIFLSFTLLVSTLTFVSVSADSPAENFRTKYAAAIEKLNSVNGAEELNTAVTETSAEGFYGMYSDYIALSDADKNNIVKNNSDSSIGKKIKAAGKRAGIWVKGEFEYNRITDSDLREYLIANNKIAAINGVEYPADCSVKLNVLGENGWCSTIFEFNSFQPQIYFGAEKNDDTLVAKYHDFGWGGGGGRGIRYLSGSWIHIIDLTSGTPMILGTYSGDTLNPYELTVSQKLIKQTDGTYRALITWDNGNGDVRSNMASNVSISSSAAQDLTVNAGWDAVYNYKLTYPEIISKLNTAKAESFCSDYAIWNSVKNGDYNTAEKIVAGVTAKNGISVYNEITKFETALASADTDVRDAVLSTEIYTNMRALKKRAGIFATAAFSFDEQKESELAQYLYSGNNLIAVSEIGSAPVATITFNAKEGVDCEAFVNAAIPANNNYSIRPQWVAAFSKSDNKLITSQWVTGWDNANPKIRIEGRGDMIIDMRSEPMVMGEYTDGTLTSYDVDFTLDYRKTENGNYKTYYTLDNNHGDVRTNNGINYEYTEKSACNEFYTVKHKFVTKVRITYPDIKKALNDSLAEAFAEDFNVMQDIHSGKYENATKIATEITGDTAEKLLNDLKEVENAMAPLTDEIRVAVVSSSYWNETLVRAMKKRAEIFTTGKFSWNRDAEADLETYFTDSKGLFVVTTNVGALPKLTFTKTLSQSAIDSYQNDEIVFVIGTSGGQGHDFKFYSYPKKDSSTGIVSANDRTAQWGPAPSMISAANGGSFSAGAIVNLKDGASEVPAAQYGIVSNGKFTAYENTITVDFGKNGNGQKYLAYGTFDDNHGFTSANNVGEYSAEEVINEVAVYTGSVYSLSKLTVEYPSLKEAANLPGPEVDGATVKIANSASGQDLRFNASFLATQSENFTPVKYGMLIIKSADLMGELTVANESVVLNGKNVSYDIPAEANCPNNFHVSIIAAELAAKEDIPVLLDTAFSARAYVVYADNLSGRLYTVYSKNDIEDKVSGGISTRSINQVISAIGEAINKNTTMIGDNWVFSSNTAMPVNVTYGNTNMTKSEIIALIEKKTDLTQEEIAKLLTFCINNRNFAIQ